MRLRALACLFGLFVLVGTGFAQKARTMPAGTEPTAKAQFDRGWRQLDKGRYQEALAAANLILLNGPLKLYVEPSSTDPGGTATKLLIQKAAQGWSDALGENIDVVICTDSSAASVVVRSMDTMQLNGREVAGYTDWKRWVHGSASGVKAVITLRTRGLSKNCLSKGAALQAAMHELGHLLGLDDGPQNGIMGLLDPANPVTKPSRSEVQLLTEIRNQARQLLQAARLKEAAS